MSALPAAVLALAAWALPAAAQTSITLVSNTGQDQAGALVFSHWDGTGSFTTGSNAAGYKLTSVEVGLGEMTGANASTATFGLSVSEASGCGAGSNTVSLTAPASPVNGFNTFTAPGTGMDLAANTTYRVELDVTAVGNGEGWAARTDSGAEESGAAAGWSIADGGCRRAWNTATWSTNSNFLMFAVKGYAKTSANPLIQSIGVVSTPSIDADNDGTAETYGAGDKIAIEAVFTEAVTVTGGNDNVRLRLDLGADDADRSNSRKVAKLTSASATTLRWEYTMAAADTDADGVWIQTASTTNDRVVFLTGGATIRDSDGNDAVRTKSGLPTSGDAGHKVDGSRAGNTTGPPGAPSAPVVEKGSTSGSLSVSWTNPQSGSAITDYDVRYYKGAADPSNESDWVTEGAPGLPHPDTARTATSVTIKGLLANSAYRVQVRAESANGEGPWSASGSATTDTMPTANNPPRVMTQPDNIAANACEILTDPSVPAQTVSATAGAYARTWKLVERTTETTQWPASCTAGGQATNPIFDDRDAEELVITMSYTLPDNVRQFSDSPQLSTRLFFRGFAAFQSTDVRIDLTATDPHGASVSTHIIFRVNTARSTSAPSFASTASARSFALNEAITPFVLPAATGGDVTNSFGTALPNPYFYKVTGLPAGLSFDPSTRTVSGTPTAAGSSTVTYTAEDTDGEDAGDSPDPMDTAKQTFTINITGGTPGAPSAPSAPSVSKGSTSGSLSASWTAPSSGSAITDYDVRYYKGAADPSNESDWVTEGAPGLPHPDTARTATSVTIKGLLANTAYRVQVRAENASGEGPWSPSGSATTDTMPTANNAPRLVEHNTDPGNRCQLKTDASTPSATVSASAGDFVSHLLVTRGSETTEWPTLCDKSKNGSVPVFDDRDADPLIITFDHTLPDNVRLLADVPRLSGSRLFFAGFAAYEGADARIDLTATDPHGASVSAHVIFSVTTTPDRSGAPSFASTASARSFALNEAIEPFVLPAATGGDVTSIQGTAFPNPYFYKVTGLPAGLSFDPSTRTVSGTPTAGGSHTVTYLAEDADGEDAGDSPDPMDTAKQTFTITITGGTPGAPSAPSAPSVSKGSTSGSLSASWTAPSAGASAITDYDVRYYKGSADPSDESDWVTEGAPGLPHPDTARTATSVTIKGLLANSAYRVQVRAENASGEGPWSASGSATTDTMPTANRAPRLVEHNTDPTNRCQPKTDTTTPSATVSATAGAFVSHPLVTRGSETTEWPTECDKSKNGSVPVFDDRDADALIITVDPVLPDNVRLLAGFPRLEGYRLFFGGFAAFEGTDARIDLTATDPHGASASAHVIFTVTTTPDRAGAPSFASTASARSFALNQAIAPFVLPAATGGDVTGLQGTAFPNPYFYKVTGLPAGLSFDPSTRTVSGTPTVGGSHTVTYLAEDSDGEDAGDSPDPNDTASQTFTITITGGTPGAPSAPSAPSVSKGSTSGSLSASWTAPSSGSAITDYDVRYYKGSADPSDESDWVTEGAPGLPHPDTARTATSVTIKGLLANSAYRVQVRAENASGEGPWSPSGSATTASPPSTNNAPRLLEGKSGDANNQCQEKTSTSTPWAVATATVGNIKSIGGFVVRGSETSEWPTLCTRQNNRKTPMFDDRDAEQLIITMDYTLPDNVRVFSGYPSLTQPDAQPGGSGVEGLLYFRGYAAYGRTDVRVDLTATDPHGASVTGYVVYQVQTFGNQRGAPSFTSTASARTFTRDEAIEPFVLPAATGGDVRAFGNDLPNPHFYKVTGLPAGLSFDASTRTVSGTPTTVGSSTVTYQAEDADGSDAGDGNLTDTAQQTFTIRIRAPTGSLTPGDPSAPDAPTVSKGSTSGSLTASWTAPSTGSTITDYDVRYYKGSADPSDESDWVTEGAPGLPNPGTATSVTIRGLLANTAYRVQVRAETVEGEEPWSLSGSATTDTVPTANNAPRLMEAKSGDDNNACQLKTDTKTPWETTSVPAGIPVSQGRLVVRISETTEWPAACTRGANRWVPMFDDRDADPLVLTMDYTLPDNVRVLSGYPRLIQPTVPPGTFSGQGTVFFGGFAAFQPTDVRIDLTATDPHGASVSGHIIFTANTLANTSAPSFASTASGRSFRLNEAIDPFVLPAATGGDVEGSAGTPPNPYIYKVTGLPTGLSFDPSTRTVSGTPTQEGSREATYTAEDLDGADAGDSPDPMDTASQKFTINVVTGTVPTVTDAEVDGATLTLTFSENLSTTTAPAASRFTVAGTATATTVTGVAFASGDAKKVELTLSRAVGAGETGITVSYARGNDANPLRNAAGTVQVNDFTGQSVTNETPPAVASARVNGTALTLTFDVALKTGTAPAASRFTVSGTAATTTVTAAAIPSGDATKVNLTLSTAVGGGETGITLSYAAGGDANALQSAGSVKVADFTNFAVTNAVGAAGAPSAPPAPSVSQGSTSGRLSATWSAPNSGGSAITDYDLRYYEGSADPADEEDWLEEDETNGPADPGTSTSATLTGLLANTAYRIQVRAENANGEGPWSPSGSGTTGTPPASNNAPRLVEQKAEDANNNICGVKTDTSTPWATVPAAAGTVVSQGRLVVRISETTEWPAACTRGANRFVPMFDDRDADPLTLTMSYTLPDNVRVLSGYPRLHQPTVPPGPATGQGRLYFVGLAAFQPTPVRIDLTATDPHGASASGHIIFTANPAANTSAPSFSATASGRSFRVNEAIEPFILPAATGGDVGGSTGTPPNPYIYQVTGLPAGLSFDPATRTVSGTPTATGSSTVTYTAEDLDDADAGDSPDPMDTARQTFTIDVVTGTVPTVTDAEVDGSTLTLTFSESLSTTTAPAASRFTVAGTAAATTVTGAAFVSGDATKVELTLSAAVGASETGITVSYARGDDANPLRNAAGTVKANDFSAQSVTNANAPRPNSAPRVMETASGSEFCAVKTDLTTPWDRLAAPPATFVNQGNLVTRRSETTELPARCSGANRIITMFDDRDADALTISMSYTVPDNVRFLHGTPRLFQPGSSTWPDGRLFFSGAAALRQTDVRVDLTATDPHGASATTHIIVEVGVFSGTSAPRFTSTASGRRFTLNEAITPFVLPAATGGDTSVPIPGDGGTTIAFPNPHFYSVTGLPTGLSFDASTRTVSGTPTAAGTYTVTYSAEDADAEDAGDGNLTDTARHTFTIDIARRVTGPPAAPRAPTVTRASATSLSVSWLPPASTGARPVHDYDLRYYAGTADPSNPADWIEEGEPNGPPNPGVSTSATITGLAANAEYRVQVRAEGDGESPWSASGSTSGPQPNRPPAARGSIPAVQITAGSSQPVDAANYFSDPDDDQLAYSASSSNVAIATVAMNGSTATVTGVAAGSAVVTITARDEAGETAVQSVRVTVVAPVGIANITVSLSGGSALEGSRVTFRVSLSSAAAEDVVLAWSTARDDASGALSATPGLDFRSVTGGSVTIAAGRTEATFSVATEADFELEGNETFRVTISGMSLPAGVAIATATAVGTIEDDTPAPPAIAITLSGGSAIEGSPVMFRVDVSPPANSDVVLRWFTGRDYTRGAQRATPGEDYTAVTDGRVTVPAGSTGATFSVETLIDGVEEGDETFRATISEITLPPDAGIMEWTALGRIEDYIPPPNMAPEFESEEYAFELRENVDGSVEPAVLGTVSAMDPDGDELSYELMSGDGERFTVGASDGVVRYVGPGEDFEAEPNAYELTVRASDPDSATAETRVTVDVVNVNELPVAADDAAETDEDMAVEVAVLANDTDIDGDSLTVSSVSGAANGTVAATADGRGVRYMPDANWYGTDSFTYEIDDGNGGMASASVEVTVAPVNDAPEAADDEGVTDEDVAVEVDVLANDTDIDGDSLTVSSVSAPENGTAAVTAGGRGVRYMPGANWHGTDSFTYEIDDGNGGTASATVAVTVAPVNDAPEAADDEAATEEDRAVEVDVLANDTDLDGDGLTVAAVSTPANGTAEVTAGGRGVRYTPAADWHGTDAFTYMADDGNGGTASASVTVTVLPVNDAPVSVGAIPGQSLEEGGEPARIELGPFFADTDGDALEYRASSSDPSVVEASVSGSVLTLAPAGYGTAEVTVTAADAGGLTATQSVAVGVSDRLAREVVSHTLAGMARGHLASARMTLGRRATASRHESSRLTLLGRKVPLGTGSARSTAEQMWQGWLSGVTSRAMSHATPYASPRGAPSFAGASGMPGLGAGTGLGIPGRGGAAMGAPGTPMRTGASMGAPGGSMGKGTPMSAPGGRNAGAQPGSGDDMGLGDLFRLGDLIRLQGGRDPLQGSEFLFALGGGQEAGGGGGLRFQLWGQGDVQTFQGAPSDASDYDGELKTGYVGVDTWLTDRWLLGVAVARSEGTGGWRAGSASGSLDTRLLAVHPYLRWFNGATSIWATGGAGWGDAENVRDRGGPTEMSGLGLRLGLVELRQRLAAAGGFEFGLRADAGWAELATDTGTETLDGQTAAVNQARFGIEMSQSLRLGGLTLTPFGEANARRDGGDGQTGDGLELAGGLRARAGFLRIDAQGRMLAVHSAAGYEERGLAVTLSLGNPGGEGPSLSMSPRWGDAATGGDALWREQIESRYVPSQVMAVGEPTADGSGIAPVARDPWALDLRGGYGLRIPGNRLLTWTGSFKHSPTGPRFTLGAQIGLGFGGSSEARPE